SSSARTSSSGSASRNGTSRTSSTRTSCRRRPEPGIRSLTRKPRASGAFFFNRRGAQDERSVFAARQLQRIGRAYLELVRAAAALRNCRHDDLNLVEVEVLGLERREDELRERDDASDHEELDDDEGDRAPVDLPGGQRREPLAGDAVGIGFARRDA